MDWCLILNVCFAGRKVKKKKAVQSFCSIISLSGHRANQCSYGWPQLILHSLQALNLLSVFQLKAIWKLIKTLSISCSQVPPFLHYGSVQSQLRLCSLTHWAIHHRWRRLLWKLAAILPLGKNHLNRAKMAPGKPCDAKDFFAFIFGQPCLSCCNRITNLFYLAKHWAIRAHFIIMTEQCVTNLANSVWKWIGRERETNTGRRQRCDGLGPLPEGWVGGRA